jgi:hypothetical protein
MRSNRSALSVKCARAASGSPRFLAIVPSPWSAHAIRSSSPDARASSMLS